MVFDLGDGPVQAAGALQRLQMNLQVQFMLQETRNPHCDRKPPCDVTHGTESGDKEELCFEGTLQIHTKILLFAPVLPFISLTILLTKGLAKTCIFNKNN